MTIADGLSFQLYSSRKFPPLDAQLATLASLGYRNVEPFGGLYGDVDGLAAGLSRHGLAAPSGHFDLAMLENDPARAIEIAAKLGTRLVIAPYLVAELRPTDAAGWRALGVRLSHVRARLGDAGLTVGWHNHDFEMVPLADGSVPLDLLLEADDALLWEADVAWITRASADPVAWLDRYAGRLGAVHVKDVAAGGEKLDEDGWADLGQGVLDFPAIIASATRGGAKLFVVEHDNPSDLVRCASNAMTAAKGWAA